VAAGHQPAAGETFAATGFCLPIRILGDKGRGYISPWVPLPPQAPAAPVVVALAQLPHRAAAADGGGGYGGWATAGVNGVAPGADSRCDSRSSDNDSD
jgi:hypothetical protein